MISRAVGVRVVIASVRIGIMVRVIVTRCRGAGGVVTVTVMVSLHLRSAWMTVEDPEEGTGSQWTERVNLPGNFGQWT